MMSLVGGAWEHDCNELKMVLYNFAREAPATPFSQEELQAASTNIKCSLEDGESLVSKSSYVCYALKHNSY